MEQPFSVALFDLDGFKEINDTCGHAAGDLVLRKAAEALQGIVREGDVLGRYGGDEFLLITYGDLASAESIPARADAAVNGVTGLGISTGIARFPGDGTTEDLLVERADAQLAEAKARRYAKKGTTRRGFERRESAVIGE